MRIQERRGFTMMEMILAMTLFAIVMASSYGIIHQGLQVWRRTQGPALQQRKILLAFERMGGDMRQATKIKKAKEAGLSQKGSLEFEGNEVKLILPSRVEVFDSAGNSQTQFGRVSYEWNSGNKTLCRRVESATDLYRGYLPECKVIAQDLDRMKFRYWLYDGIGEGYSWYDDWDKGSPLPQAIEVTAELSQDLPDGTTTRKKYHQLFTLPMGGKL